MCACVCTHMGAQPSGVRASAPVSGGCGCLNDSASDSAREMQDTNGLLREELEGLQRRLGRQEKMQETLVGLELEKEVSRPVSGVLRLPRGPCTPADPLEWRLLGSHGGWNSGP